MSTIFLLRIVFIHSIFLAVFFLLNHAMEKLQTHPMKRAFLPLPGQMALSNSQKQYFDNSNLEFKTQDDHKHQVIRVQQFNVLADGLSGLRPDLGRFRRATKEILDWDKRKHLLLHEIVQYDADIITLQECDHYYDFLLPELSMRGYSGYFAPKPTSACLDVSPNSDGCALFIKYDRIQVVSIETKTLALSIAKANDAGELIEDDTNIKAQNQVGLIAICELRNRAAIAAVNNGRMPPPIIIGTTHLKSSKTATGERYRQKGIMQTLNEINRIYLSMESIGRTPAVLLTGDFNASPVKTSYSEPLTYRAVKSHNLGFRSVYNEDLQFSTLKMSSDELYTTWKSRVGDGENKEIIVKRCIDYIFYIPYKKGIVKNSEEDRMLTQTTKVTAFSTDQIAIAFLLRLAVYFCGALIPATCIVSGQLEIVDKIIVLLLSALGIGVFEGSSQGSIFKPQVAANVDPTPIRAAVQEVVAASFEEDKVEKNDILSSIGAISNKIQPLRQYGRPGLQAVKLLDLFSTEEIGPDLIPSSTYPSDHVSIVADFQILW